MADHVFTSTAEQRSGAADATPAFHAAFATIAAAGGGRLRVPPGRYLVAGLHPVSGLHLDLAPGAVLEGPRDLAAYPPDPTWEGDRFHVVHAIGCRDLVITGGVIRGNGSAFWQPPLVPGGWLRADPIRRPSPMVDLSQCQDVRLEGVHFDDSAGWSLHLHECDRVLVDRCRITADPAGPNTDGIDISGCDSVTIRDSVVTCGDDGVVLFPSRARRCSRIIVDGCRIETLCVALKAYTMPEFPGAVEDVIFSRCQVRASNRVLGCYAVGPGPIQRIAMSDVQADTDSAMVLNRPIHLDARIWREDGIPVGGIHHVRVRGLHCRTDGRILMTAADGAPIRDVGLDDITLEYPRLADPAQIPNQPGLGSGQDSNRSPIARRIAAAMIAEGIDGLQVRGLRLRFAVGDGQPWREGPLRWNGAHELFARTERPTRFLPWWIRGGDADLCPITASQRGPQGEAGWRGPLSAWTEAGSASAGR